MLHLVKPLQTKILARSSCSKPDRLQTQSTDSPVHFPWINTPGMCHAWMLAYSCSCRYPCFQFGKTDMGVNLHSDLLQLKTSWWKLMLRMGLPEGFFCHVPDVALLLPLFKDAQSGCLCEVSPFRATTQKSCAVSGHGLSGPISCPMVLFVGSLGGVRARIVHSSDCGHSGVQYQDVWHIWLPSTCGYQHPAKSWNLLSIGKEGK